MDKLLGAIQHSQFTSPIPDKIHNQMLFLLQISAKVFLPAIYTPMAGTNL